MQDSQLKYYILVEGADKAAAQFKLVGNAAKQAQSAVANNTKTLKDGTHSINSLAGATDKADKATQRASKSQRGYFGHIAKTTIQSALINKLFLEMVDVSGKAIQQVDLLNNFPATMESMGQSTEAANKSLAQLTTYVGQIGADMGEAVSMVTRFTGVTENVGAATAIFMGINNALIAGDSSAMERAEALKQFAQALERGLPDMREWRNLTQNMSFQLGLVAEEMGYVNSNALGEALRNGEESMASFVKTLTELSTGSGPIAEQMLTRLQGVQFAFAVMKNTMVQGLAAIINAFGRATIVGFFTTLTGAIRVLVGWVITAINAFVWLFNIIGGLFGLRIGNIVGEAQGVAEGIGAGAEAAGDLADGLDDAGGSAKKLNKSLAAFDKMNVLPDKESGGGGGGSGGGGGGAGGVDPGAFDGLEDILGGITDGLKEASIWAKILAGFFATLASISFANKLIDGLRRTTNNLKAAKIAADNFKKSLFGAFDEESGKKVGGLSEKIKGIPVVITTGFAGLGKVLANPYVLAAAAVLALVAGIVYLYNTNEEFKKGFDSVWGPIISTLKTAGETIIGVVGGALKWLGEQFSMVLEPIMPILDPIIEWFKGVGRWIKGMAEKLGLLNAPMETLGKIVGVVAAIFIGQFLIPIIGPILAVAAAIGVIIAVIVAVVYTVRFLWRLWNTIWGKINEVAQSVWQGIQSAWDGVTDFFVGIWHGVYDVFTAVWNWIKEWGLTIYLALTWPFWLVVSVVLDVVQAILNYFVWLWETIVSVYSAVATWFKEQFSKAWNAIVKIWDTVAGWFSDVWNAIVDVFSVVSDWFKEQFSKAWNAVVEIWNTVSEWFRINVWNRIVAVFSVVGEWFKEQFNNAVTNIKNVWSTISSWFRGRWEDIKSVFSGVKQWFSDRFTQALDAIKSVFSGVKDWFKTNVVDKIADAFTGIKDRIGGFFSGVWDGVGNGLKSALNTILRLPLTVPSITVAGKTIGGQTLIPRLARGGVVNQATLAVVGEAGSEAVVPLENNTEWIDKLASKINSSTGGGGQPINLTIQIGEEEIASKLIDLINEKTSMSGRNAIHV